MSEEAGIEIKNIRYVTSLADAREDDDPSLVISCLAEWASGDVRLDQSMVDFRWVTLEEAKSVDLIEGIFEEIQIADKVLKDGSAREWSKE